MTEQPNTTPATPGPTGTLPAPAAGDAPAPRPPSDRYDLGAEIARGGMGAVLAARDTVLDRDVAVKVLLARASDASAARFVAEARITGVLQHPGIPPVYDLGELPDGRPFLAMKLIKGHTLHDLLKKRADPVADLPRFVQVFEQIAQAVGYAHRQRIIHRDLKPLNVMVGAFGEVQVMDWGLAKVLARRGGEEETTSPDALPASPGSMPDATQAGSVMGTPSYMPPEQARGLLKRVDRRSDVFGLGAILAVILTGRPPYRGSTANSTYLRAAAGKLGSVLTALDGCGADPELVALCKRCLSVRRSGRPADGGAVADAVAAVRAAVEERARKAERDAAAAVATAEEQRKRRRVQVALASSVAALAVVTGVGAWWAQRQAAVRAGLEADRERTELLDRAKADARTAAAATAAADALGLLPDLARRALWPAARAALDAVPADADDGVRARVAAARADVELAAKLDAVRLDKAVAKGGKWDPEAGKAYIGVFREAGMDFASAATDVSAVAARIGTSPVKEPILDALDDCAWNLKNAEAGGRMWAVTARVRGQPWRAALGVSPAVFDGVGLSVLNDHRDELSPGLFSAIGVTWATRPPKRDDGLAVLKDGLRRYPSDFWLHLYLGDAYALKGQADLASAAYRAAVAVRPDAEAVKAKVRD